MILRLHKQDRNLRAALRCECCQLWQPIEIHLPGSLAMLLTIAAGRAFESETEIDGSYTCKSCLKSFPTEVSYEIPGRDSRASPKRDV